MSGEKNPFWSPELEESRQAGLDRHYEEGEGNETPVEAKVDEVKDETRDAVEQIQIPMGPEPRTETPVDDETADKYGEGDGAREDGNLIPGYPGDVNRR